MKKAVAYIADKCVNILIAIIILPFLIPIFGPLWPNLIDWIQTNIVLLNDSTLNSVIRCAASGYGDGSSVVISMISGLICIGSLMGFSLIMRSAKDKLLKEGKKASLAMNSILVLIIIFLCVLIFDSSREFNMRLIAMNIDKAFQKNMRIISPYISIQEEKELRSQYALMVNRDNLRSIDHRIIPIMKQNGIPVSEKQ